MHAMPPVTGALRSISTGTAARLVGCDASTVKRAIARGELDAYRLGRRGMYRIDVAALRDWARPAHDLEEPTR